MKQRDKEQLLSLLRWASKRQSMNDRTSMREAGVNPDDLRWLYDVVGKIKTTDKKINREVHI